MFFSNKNYNISSHHIKKKVVSNKYILLINNLFYLNFKMRLFSVNQPNPNPSVPVVNATSNFYCNY